MDVGATIPQVLHSHTLPPTHHQSTFKQPPQENPLQLSHLHTPAIMPHPIAPKLPKLQELPSLPSPKTSHSMPPPSTTNKKPKSTRPASTRDGTELLEGELYLDNLEIDDVHWGKLVRWAYKHPARVLSPSEVPEAEHLQPNVKIARDTLDNFCSLLNERLPGIPGNTVANLVKVFSGSDLINAVNPNDIYSMELPTANATAGFIPVPDMARFNPKEPFGGQTCWTYGVVHGTTVSAAVSILLEGIIRPSD